MEKLLTPSFFRFLFGFLVILAVSFSLITLVGFWDREGTPAATSVSAERE